MKYLPWVIFGGIAIGAAVAFKRNGFPGTDKAIKIKNIKEQMAEALAQNNTQVYELLRLELESEREL